MRTEAKLSKNPPPVRTVVKDVYHTANIGRKSYAKITKFVGYIFATKTCIDNRKNVKQQHLLHMLTQHCELQSTDGWDRLASLGTPVNFNEFRSLASLYCTDVRAHRRSTKLCRMFRRLLGW